MNLDLNILKSITTNKTNALTFVSQCDHSLFTTEYFFFSKQLIEYLKFYKELPTKRTLLDRVKNNPIQVNTITQSWDAIEAHEYNDSEFAFDLLKLKERKSKQSLIELSKEIQKEDSKNLKELVNKVKETTSKISSMFDQNKFDQKTLKDAIPDFREHYTATQKNKDFGRGILTGYKSFDKVLNGIRKQEFLLVGGETGGGKSVSLMNHGVQMWMQSNTIDMVENFSKGYNIVFFALEMPLQDTMQRVIARMAMVSQKEIRDAELTKEDLDRVKKSIAFINNYPYNFEIVDASQGCSLDFIESTLADIKSRYIPDVVIIDYMALMDADSAQTDEQDWLKLEKLSEKLFKLGRTHNVVILSAVQLTDLKTSGSKGVTGQHRIARAKGVLKNVNFFIQLIKRENEERYTDMAWSLIKSRRTELTQGSYIKNFKCCALLDSYSDDDCDDEHSSNEKLNEIYDSI